MSAAKGSKVRSVGFEPTTYCLEGSCSVRLSYGRRRGSLEIAAARHARGLEFSTRGAYRPFRAASSRCGDARRRRSVLPRRGIRRLTYAPIRLRFDEQE